MSNSKRVNVKRKHRNSQKRIQAKRADMIANQKENRRERIARNRKKSS